jgi:hypothetical protein
MCGGKPDRYVAEAQLEGLKGIHAKNVAQT